MPHLSRIIDFDVQHRNLQPRSAPRNRFDHSPIAHRKLCSIQCHLPALPSRQPRLLANIHYHCGKLIHFVTAAARASISRLLPTQKGVR